MTLEDEFWRAFQQIAKERNLPISALAAELDDSRGLERGLASSIRVYVLNYYKTTAEQALKS